MNKPLNMIFIIPKNEAHFCVQCECFVNLNICPICHSDTLDMSSILDKNLTRPADNTEYCFICGSKEHRENFHGSRPAPATGTAQSTTCPACLNLCTMHDWNCSKHKAPVLTPEEEKLYDEGSALESYADQHMICDICGGNHMMPYHEETN